MPLRSFLLFMALCCVWAMNMVTSRLVVDGLSVPPIMYAALRAGVGGLIILPWLRPIPPQLPKVIAVTFAITGGASALLLMGLQTTSPSTASIIGLTSAPLTVVLAILILGERVRWRRALGIALTFVGVLVAIANPAGWDADEGVLLIVGSSLVGSLGAVFLKQLSVAPLRLQAWGAMTSAVTLIPLSLMVEAAPVSAVLSGGWKLAAALFFSGLVVSVGAHTLYFRILQKYDANLVSPLTLMTPVFTIALGAAITGDSVGVPLLVGGAIAAAGVMVIILRPSSNVFKPMLVRSRL